MKKVLEFLKENQFEYEENFYGNPMYFNDGFKVKGISVSFYFDEVGNTKKQERLLLDFFRRKKKYHVKSFQFGAGFTYRIMKEDEAKCLELHERKVHEAIKKFWEERQTLQA